MDFNSIKIETKKNNVCFNFLRDHDFILPIDEQKTSFGQSLDDVFRVKSEHSGLIFNLQDTLQLSNFLNCNIIQKSTINPALFVKNNHLTSYFYILIEADDIKFFVVFEFKSQNSTLTREDWYMSNCFPIRNCCRRNFLSQPNLTISNLDELKKITDTDLDLFCCFPKKIVDVKTQAWFYVLNYNNNLIKSKFENLNLVFMKPKLNNIFGGVPVEYNFFYSSQSRIERTLSIEKSIQSSNSRSSNNLEDSLPFPPPTNFDLKLGIIEFLDPSNPNCKEFITKLSLKDDSFKQYLIGCLYTIYKITSINLESSKLNKKLNQIIYKKLQFKSKLLYCSFFF